MSWSVSGRVADHGSVRKLEPTSPLSPRQQNQFEQARKMAAQIVRRGHLGGYGKRKVYDVTLSGHANDNTRQGGGTINISVTQVLLEKEEVAPAEAQPAAAAAG